MSKAEKLSQEIVEYLFDDYPDNNEMRQDAVKRVAALLEPHLVGEWLPIDENTPKQTKLVVAYRNSLGKWRRVFATYYAAETLESEMTDSGWSEPGWYEECESAETIYPVEHEPALWQYPPAPPKGEQS